MLAPEEDAALFHRLYPMVLRYAAASSKEKSLLKSLTPPEVSSEAAVKARELLFSKPSLIKKFVLANPEKLSQDELALVRGWEHFRIGKFIIERSLKKHTIFLEWTDDPTGYGVLGLNSPIEEMIGYERLPVVVNTVLLPWKGKIVHDGLFAMMPISFGSGIRRTFKESYMEAKSRGIVTSLSSTR